MSTQAVKICPSVGAKERLSLPLLGSLYILNWQEKGHPWWEKELQWFAAGIRLVRANHHHVHYLPNSVFSDITPIT